MRPALALVPPELPFSAGDVLQRLAQGPWDGLLDSAYQAALGALIPSWVSRGCGLADFDVLAEHNRHVQRRWNARLLVGCDLVQEIAVARRMLDWRELRVASAREVP